MRKIASDSRKRVVVIGGGAAGLLAAARAAEEGAHVTLLEKKKNCGLKLRITGKGRCNLTNIAPIQEFVGHFGKNGRFLKHAFAAFFSQDLINLLGNLQVSTVTERGGRVFPESQAAQDIVDALTQNACQKGVTIQTNKCVNQLNKNENRISGITCEDGSTLPADFVILTTGGRSYPGTGSTGDGYALARAMGHTIVKPRPALVSLETPANTAQRLQGLSLKNVNASLWCEDKKVDQSFGEMLFTHFGLSGPIILNLSIHAVDLLEQGKKPVLAIDWKPALDDQKLEARLLRELQEHGKQQMKSILKLLLPQKAVSICAEDLKIPLDKPGHQIGADERKRLRLWLKNCRFSITRHRGWNEAIVTAGGVKLNEVNPKTMESRLVRGLHIAGEVLDLDADTGGYNLQAAFSTGWVAGASCSWAQASTHAN